MGKKGKAAEKKPEGVDILTEVDKTFYELQITDLNRKLARQRTFTTELEEKNIQLEQQYNKLDDDRGDVIIYLKRSVQEKQNEVSELQERLTAIQEAKESEAAEFVEKMGDMDTEYKQMREQLTSEIKLLTGKLNALEEFRIQRDELMQRYEEQEKNIEEQEIRQRRVLYDIEKKFILSKDAIKKEMEKQLFELGASFEKANDLRIAATTQRAIRENIVINNELNKLIATNGRLEKANQEYYSKNKDLQRLCDLYTTERNKALSDSRIQKGVINQLTKEHEKLTETLQNNVSIIEFGKEQERNLRECLKHEKTLQHKIQLLEQNLHATRCQEIALKTEITNATAYCYRYRGLMLEASSVIMSAMMIQASPDLPEAEKIYKRESLLSNLLNLLTAAKDNVIPISRAETVPSMAATYAKGDLGFIPKIHTEKRPPPMRFNMDSQVGLSFEELLKARAEQTESSMELLEFVEEELLEEEIEESLTPGSEKLSAGGEGASDESAKVTPPTSDEEIPADEAGSKSTVYVEGEGHDTEIHGEFEEADAAHETLSQATEGMDDSLVGGEGNDGSVAAESPDGGEDAEG